MKQFLVTSLILAVPLAAAPANQATYKPPLVPRFTAGQAFGYTATVQYQSSLRVTELRKTHVPGDKEKNIKGTDKISESDAEKVEENFTAEMVAEGALARSVFPNGAIREALFLVNRCVLVNNNDGKEQVLVPKGAIIGMKVLDDGQTAFAVDGDAPSQELADRLSLLIAQLGDGRCTFDEMLGPAQAMPVGSGWQVNTNAIMRSVLTQMFPGTNQVAGSLRLDEVKSVAGMPTAFLSGVYDLGGSRPPFPAQVQSRPSLVHFRVNLSTPAAPGPGTYDYTMNAVIQHQGSNGDIKAGMSEARIEFQIAMDRDARFLIEGSRTPLAALLAAPPILDKFASDAKPGVTTAHFFSPPPMKKEITVSAPDSRPPPLVDLDTPAQQAAVAAKAAVDNRPSRSYIAPPPNKAAGTFSGIQVLNANGTTTVPPASANTTTPTEGPSVITVPKLEPLPPSPFGNATPISTP